MTGTAEFPKADYKHVHGETFVAIKKIGLGNAIALYCALLFRKCISLHPILSSFLLQL